MATELYLLGYVQQVLHTRGEAVRRCGHIDYRIGWADAEDESGDAFEECLEALNTGDYE